MCFPYLGSAILSMSESRISYVLYGYTPSQLLNRPNSPAVAYFLFDEIDLFFFTEDFISWSSWFIYSPNLHFEL